MPSTVNLTTLLEGEDESTIQNIVSSMSFNLIIAANSADILSNSSDITTNATNIAANTALINTNTTNITANTTNIATNTASLLNKMENLSDDTSPQLSEALDCNGHTLNGTSVRQARDVSTSGAVTFDYGTSDMVQLTATGDITSMTFSNFPVGVVAGYIIEAVNWGAYTITHPATMLFSGGLAPTYTASGMDRILVTSDKDGILTLTVVNQDVKVV